MAVLSSANAIYTPGSLVEAFAKGCKSLFSSPNNERQSWVEISPYGFVSHNYMRFVAGRLDGCSISELPDGSNVVNFKDGSFIVQSITGHVVEIDRLRRVILVKVMRSEAEGAKLALGRPDFEKCYEVKASKTGALVSVMPGNIIIGEDETQVSVTLPNGTSFFAKKAA